MDISVYVRDRSRQLVGVLDTWTQLDLVLRANDVGTWAVTVPVGPAADALATAGAGLVVVGTGGTLISGPLTKRVEQWSDADPGAGTLVLSGVSDMIELVRNLAEPDPLHAGIPTVAYDRITGPAETVIRSYVDRNIGPGSLPGRIRHPLGQTANLGAGNVVTGNARYDVLRDLVVSLAGPGGVGFRVAQDAGSVVPLFDVYVPADRSSTAIFGRGAGNLVAYSFTLSAPAVTRALVAGGGEGVLRTLVEATDSAVEADWDMVSRVFVDRRDTADPVEMAQAGADALTDGAATAGLSLTPIDTPSLTYGVHYQLGDRVTVQVDPTTQITDVITQVTISVSGGSGTVLTPVVGAGDNAETPALFAQLRKLGARVGLLEKRV